MMIASTSLEYIELTVKGQKNSGLLESSVDLLSIGMMIPVWKHVGTHALNRMTVNNDDNNDNSLFDFP